MGHRRARHVAYMGHDRSQYRHFCPIFALFPAPASSHCARFSRQYCRVWPIPALRTPANSSDLQNNSCTQDCGEGVSIGFAGDWRRAVERIAQDLRLLWIAERHLLLDLDLVGVRTTRGKGPAPSPGVGFPPAKGLAQRSGAEVARCQPRRALCHLGNGRTCADVYLDHEARPATRQRPQDSTHCMAVPA